MPTPNSLVSLVLSFTRDEAVELPRDLGRASHALLLRLLASHDAALAESVHAADGPRPFTCSGVMGGRRRDGALLVSAGDSLWVRYTGLSSPVSVALQAVATAPPASVELDGIAFRVLSATLDPAVHPRASLTTYEALSAPYLLARQSPASRITFRFVSPTAFRAKNQNVPLPLPGSVFGSLADRWNAFAPIALPDEIRRFAEECMALSRMHARTAVLRGKDGSAQVGFVGVARFAATNRDRYWLSLINVLADFATYSGVGAGTAQAMGQVRRIEDEPPSRSTGIESAD